MKHFHGESSLKTWIYRIALHEAANRRRWWFRHKAHETSIEPAENECDVSGEEWLVDPGESPFENFAHEEVRAEVEQALHAVPEPYRTAIVLRDLEEMSYDEISEVLQISLGTVKSRITRGRDALRKRLSEYARQVGPELGLAEPEKADRESRGSREVEVTP